MRPIVLVLGLAALAAGRPASAAEPPADPKKGLLPGEYAVALVNGEAIPHSDILAASRSYRSLLVQRGQRVGAETWTATDEAAFAGRADALRRKVLARIVARRLLFQEAQRALVADLVKRFGRDAMRQLFGDPFRDEIGLRSPERARMTLGMYRLYDRGFNRRLEMRLRDLGGPDGLWKAHGLTPEQFRQIFFEQSIVLEYRQRVLLLDPAPTPKEVRAFYTTNRTRFWRDESVEARLLTIRWDVPPVGGGPVRSRAAARELAGRLRAEAAADPARFGALVRAHSDDAETRARGGRMGTGGSRAFVRGTYEEVIEREAFVLKPGAVSEVIATREAFLVLLVEARNPAGAQPLAEVETAIRRELREGKTERQERMLVARLYDRAAVLDADGRRIPYEVLYGERPVEPVQPLPP